MGDNINSGLIQLTALEGQYKQKLTEYESAYATYISALQSQNNGSNSFVVLPGQKYMGTGSISDITNSTTTTCEAACSANSLCTGASFNSISNICQLRSGNSLLSVGATSDNAIISEVRQKLINLETINAQLIEINNQMTTIYKQLEPDLQYQKNTMTENNYDLIVQYFHLMEEKAKIQKLLDEYNDINKNNSNMSLMADQENSSYYLWLIIAAIAITLTLKFIFFPESKGNLISVVMWTILIICMALMTIHLNNPTTFFVWTILVIIVLMMKSKLIPSI